MKSVSNYDVVRARDEFVVQSNTTNFTVVNIMEDSCVPNFETVACIRSSILAGLAALTAVLCVIKLFRLHLAHHPSCHQYVIFYAAALECAIGSIHWIFLNVTQLDFLLEYIKLLQVLIMCHYYITLAIRALRKENLADRFMYPFLVIAVLYFTIMTSLGIFNAESSHVECIAPYWLALSGAELVVVQLFAVSGFYITRRLNEISTLDSVRWSQKRDLWCIVIVFELSALGMFVYDLTMQILGDRDSGCSAIFSHRQVVYSPLLVSLMVMKLLLPIWVMLVVFQPHKTATEKDEVFPAYSEDGTYGSVFSDDLTYRQLYQPVDSFTYCTPIPSPNGSPCMYDAALPYVYVNPSMVRSSLQTIAEENNDDKQEKKPAEVKVCPPVTDGTAPRTARTQGQFKRGKFITRIIKKSSKIDGDIL
uniref:G-protein coupled receptors family 3 profile domain-containing protein n=1 Tax=Arion vulgaris TaxID=1028688 RepID=A0A0B6Y979_9EUPU